jgi:hypothetical protein
LSQIFVVRVAIFCTVHLGAFVIGHLSPKSSAQVEQSSHASIIQFQHVFLLKIVVHLSPRSTAQVEQSSPGSIVQFQHVLVFWIMNWTVLGADQCVGIPKAFFRIGVILTFIQVSKGIFSIFLNWSVVSSSQ